MSDNEDAMSEVDVPTALNPYEVLSLAQSATEDEIKKAYRKAALKNHPDKVSPDRKEEAHSAFQRIAFAYAILSDPSRRKLYDETGSTSDIASSDPDWSWSDFYRAQYADVVTGDAIEAFRSKYRHSEEERMDLLAAYTRAEGDMDVVYTEVMLSDVLEDDERFRAMIDKAIADGEVESFPTYRGESKAKREKRKRKARNEAKEAEEMARHLGVHDKIFGGAADDDADLDGDDNDEETAAKSKNKKGKGGKGDKKKKDKEDPHAGLAALIRSRQAGRSNNISFLDRLAEKYGAKEPGSSGKNKKGKKSAATKMGEDEPDDDAFEATRRKIEEQRSKKRKAQERDHAREEEEGEEVAAPPPKKRASRRIR